MTLIDKAKILEIVFGCKFDIIDEYRSVGNYKNNLIQFSTKFKYDSIYIHKDLKDLKKEILQVLNAHNKSIFIISVMILDHNNLDYTVVDIGFFDDIII